MRNTGISVNFRRRVLMMVDFEGERGWCFVPIVHSSRAPCARVFFLIFYNFLSIRVCIVMCVRECIVMCARPREVVLLPKI